MAHARKSSENRKVPRRGTSQRETLVPIVSLSSGALVAFVVLATSVKEGATMALDVALLTQIHSLSPAWLETPMVAVTTLGSNSVLAVVLAIAAYFFYRAGSKLEALFLPVCALGSMVLATTLKNLDRRTRPHLFAFRITMVSARTRFRAATRR